MAFPIPLTVNLNDLADCHFQAAMDLINHDDAKDDQDIYDVTIEIDGIDTELQFLTLKERLEDVLTEYKLEEHFPNILYLYSIFLQADAGDFLYKEELLKHASKTIKQLIALQKIKDGSQTKDLSLKIRNERIRFSFSGFVVVDVFAREGRNQFTVDVVLDPFHQIIF